ncbi:DUF177 domain-containing protein [bacterium]|nr:DUF177 domain-containing protein [bacterium]MBU1883918.1 DUF177 domain-containing protein [bacterium]
MIINFRKVTKTPLDFNIESNNIVFKGSLKYDGENLVLLQATITGSIDLDCYLCANEVVLPLNEDVEFLISDGAYSGLHDDYDVVESFDGHINIEELLNSEIELIKSGYHSCEDCK